MQAHAYTALVTLLALAVYFWMATQVARARIKCGIHPPAMSGDAILERTIRAHTNTLEWLPLLLGPLWLFSLYWSDLWAAILGVVWIVGRVVYQRGYIADPGKRFPGFFIQASAVAALLLGATGRIIYLLIRSGG